MEMANVGQKRAGQAAALQQMEHDVLNVGDETVTISYHPIFLRTFLSNSTPIDENRYDPALIADVRNSLQADSIVLSVS
jgi:hypothetical protein